MSTEIEKKIRISGLSMRFVEYLRTALPRPKLNWRTVRTALLADMERDELTDNQRDLYTEITRLAPIFMDEAIRKIANAGTVEEGQERAVAA